MTNTSNASAVSTEDDVQTWLDSAEDKPGDQPDEDTTPSDEPGALPELATPGRRFVGFVLETVLFIGTFGIGWMVWSMIEWRDGRTPAKRLLRDLIVVDAWSGERVSWRRMAIRELGAKIGLVGLFGVATFGLGWAIAAALVLSETRAALWDRLAGTAVVSPHREFAGAARRDSRRHDS